MVRLRCSFLVRWWLLDRGGSRIELEHIQSGARTVVCSSAEALSWMAASIGPEAAGSEQQPPETTEQRAPRGPPDDGA